MTQIPRQPSASSPRRKPRIIVIGAGMAGLSTALELKTLFVQHPDISPEVTILEGRKRVGGRIHTFQLHSRPMSSLNQNGYQPAGVDLG